MSSQGQLDACLISTNQRWKLTLMFRSAAVGGCAWLVSFAIGEYSQSVQWIGEGLILIGLVFGLLAIRCPHCQTRVLLYFLKSTHFAHWLFALREAKSCPICGR